MGKRTLDITDAQMCACCGKTPFKNIDLYVIEISQAIVDHQAAQQFVGLTVHFGGNPTLANMFAGRRDLAELLPPIRVLICHDCFLMKQHSLAQYWDDEDDDDLQEETRYSE